MMCMKEASLGWLDGLVGKGSVGKPDALSWVLGTHMIEGENW